MAVGAVGGGSCCPDRGMDALLMDVAAAFPSVALRGMRMMGLDENLVKRTDSFMRDRRVVMSVDGQDSEAQDDTAGRLQGPPISPALSAMYIAEMHGPGAGLSRHLLRGGE